MQTSPRVRVFLVSAFTLVSLCYTSVLVFAASGDTSTLSYPITIEQDTPTNIVSQWTLLSTTQEKIIGNLKTQVIKISQGQYTFFIDQPKGYETDVTFYNGTTVVKTAAQPQLAFTFAGEADARISVKYKLTNYGQVSVTSDPSGLKFKLQGPNLFSEEGVTPHVYQSMPIGQYSVQFFPDGCAATPPKSNELKKDGRIDLNVTIKCNPASSSSSAASTQRSASSAPASQIVGPSFPFVTITSGGTFLMLRDVPLEAWFAGYVKEVGNRGIMSGYKDEEGKPTDFFGPENWVTLEEVAKAVQTAAGIYTSADVEAENWYVEEWAAPYIGQAEQLDWLVYQDIHNDVTEQATRAEVVATILQAFDVPVRWAKGNVFSDVGRRDEYAGEIETAAAMGIVTGRKNDAGILTGEFDPEGWINRAEFAKILSVTLEKVGSASSR